MLLDEAATRSAMLDSLRGLIRSAQRGDVLVFQYAGHGTSLADLDGDEADGKDEAICPFDIDEGAYLIDDDLAEVWNLIHFRGSGPGPQHGLWDVSLGKDAAGSYQVFVFDFLNAVTRMTTGVPAVPIGAWFQLEVYFKRAADASGAFAVYQDGQLALDLTDMVTDDSEYGQWFVGNSAFSLSPPEHTLYVDDLAVREAP